MDDEQLIQIVKQRLVDREKRRIDVTCDLFVDQATPSKELFLQAKTVTIRHLPISVLYDLYHMKETPWVSWFLTGISYQVSFDIYINESYLPFVPWKMLTSWPLSFYIGNSLLVAFPEKMIHRTDIVLLKKHSWLVTLKNQQLTDEAKDLILKQQIKRIERVDKSCIWAE